MNVLPTDITHFSATVTFHHIATFLLEEILLARHAGPDHGLAHGVLQLHPVRHVAVLLHLVTGQRNVVVFLTKTTRLLSTFGVFATNNLKNKNC